MVASTGTVDGVDRSRQYPRSVACVQRSITSGVILKRSSATAGGGSRSAGARRCPPPRILRGTEGVSCRNPCMSAERLCRNERASLPARHERKDFARTVAVHPIVVSNVASPAFAILILALPPSLGAGVGVQCFTWRSGKLRDPCGASRFPVPPLSLGNRVAPSLLPLVSLWRATRREKHDDNTQAP